MELATKQYDIPTENIEKTSLIDSIINITDNPNHHTLDSMSKHIANNFVLPNQEDNFAKYLSNFNYNSMEFNSDNLELVQNNSKNTLYKMNDLFSKSNEHLKSFSKNNSFVMNNQKNSQIKTFESLVVKDQDEDSLKKLYEDNQKKIEKALIKKNLNNKDSSLHKKSKVERSLTSTIDKNYSKAGTVMSKNTGITNNSNKFSEIKENKKTYKEYTEIDKNLSKTSRTPFLTKKDAKNTNSSINLVSKQSVNDFCKKNLHHLTERKEKYIGNLSPNMNKNEINHKSNTFNKKNKGSFINKGTEKPAILNKKNGKENPSSTILLSSMKNFNKIGEMSNQPPLLISYSKQNPLQEPVTCKDQDILMIKEQLKLLDSKLESNLGELTKIGLNLREKDPTQDNMKKNVTSSYENTSNGLKDSSKDKYKKRIEDKKHEQNVQQNVRYEDQNIHEISSPEAEINKDYDIREIYQKRKSLLNQQGSPKKSYYEKNIEWKKKIEERNELLKNINDEYEIKKCSFSPKISMSSKTLSARKNDENTKSFYEKNISWKLNVERNKQEGYIEKEKKEYEECFFHPNIIKRSLSIHDINEKKRTINNDHHYQKNVEWLKKNKELKTNIQLKIEEKKSKSLKKNPQKKSNQNTKKENNPPLVNTFFSESIYSIRSISKEMESLKSLVSGLKETLDQSKVMNKILEDKAIN